MPNNSFSIGAKMNIALGVISVASLVMAISVLVDASAGRYIVLFLTLVVLATAAAAAYGFYGMNHKLRRLAGEIGTGAQQVASAAGQVSNSSQSLAQGTSQQAASLQETSASAEEINSMTQKNLENARMASDETTHVGALLQETQERLDGMVASMQDINASSEKISKIIKVIDEIAFQTNILALNAAVEAARAGEAGMGFAVVADEVRNLAQRCAQAARDTAQLIEESITRSGEGKTKLDEVTASIRKVVDNSSKVKILSNEVHLGSQEQARGIQQISKAVIQMQSLTQSSAASAEESASAGEQMSGQAKSLTDAVARLRDVVGSDDFQPQTRAAGRSPHKESSSARAAVTTTASAAKPVVAKLKARPGTPVAAARSKPSMHPSPAIQTVAAGRMALPLDDDFKDF